MTSTFRISRFDRIDSTNAEAIRRARAGEAEGLVIVADGQTEGRGREGRRWESPPGKNLYVSFLLRPAVSPKRAVDITILAANAVHDVLSDLIPSLPLSIKPPNDILLNGKKVAGILCEMGSQGERIEWVVCGIGINVNSDLSDFSGMVQRTATSLKIAFGREFEREELLKQLIEMFGKRYAKIACD